MSLYVKEMGQPRRLLDHGIVFNLDERGDDAQMFNVFWSKTGWHGERSNTKWSTYELNHSGVTRLEVQVF